MKENSELGKCHGSNQREYSRWSSSLLIPNSFDDETPQFSSKFDEKLFPDAITLLRIHKAFEKDRPEPECQGVTWKWKHDDSLLVSLGDSRLVEENEDTLEMEL